MRKLISAQFIILLIGTLFAWTNFTVELISWLKKAPCTIGCTVLSEPPNPFVAPCFYGALFFTAAFVLSEMLLRRIK
jgi:hypothetical protein